MPPGVSGDNIIMIIKSWKKAHTVSKFIWIIKSDDEIKEVSLLWSIMTMVDFLTIEKVSNGLNASCFDV